MQGFRACGRSVQFVHERIKPTALLTGAIADGSGSAILRRLALGKQWSAAHAAISFPLRSRAEWSRCSRSLFLSSQPCSCRRLGLDERRRVAAPRRRGGRGRDLHLADLTHPDALIEAALFQSAQFSRAVLALFLFFVGM